MSSRCFSCMNPIPAADSICPHCGHDNHIRDNGMGYLPACILQNQYLVGRALGRGGFGITYLGYDLMLERVVAIKEYFPASMSVRLNDSFTLSAFSSCETDFKAGCERALKESRTAARLGQIHGIVQIYNVFPANNTIYIIMEYVDGITFADLIKQGNGILPWPNLLALMNPIMDTLGKLHGVKIIHRDIKPENIMIRRTSGEPVLLDFGAARVISDATVSRDSMVVSQGFAPIEQYGMGVMDERVDQYALCATMLCALTGERPPDATSRILQPNAYSIACTAENRLTEPARRALLRGFSVRAEDRYATMNELKAALNAVSEEKNSAGNSTGARSDSGVPSEPTSKAEPMPKPAPQPSPTPKPNPAPAANVGAQAKPASQKIDIDAIFKEDPPPAPQPPKKKGHPVLMFFLLAAIGTVAFWYFTQGSSRSSSARVTTAPRVTATPRRTTKPTPKPTPKPTAVPPATSASSFTTAANEDGTLSITKYTGTATDVVIPGTIGGKTVTIIEEEAFKNNTELTSVVFPSTLTEIGYRAFDGCSNLRNVTLPDGLIALDSYAFMNCDQFTTITIPAAIDSIGVNPFAYCNNLQEIIIADGCSWITMKNNMMIVNDENVISSLFDLPSHVVVPEGITHLRNNAFSGCTGMQTISLPNTLTTIEGYAFWGCPDLTEVVIPDSVTTLDDKVFYNCDNLTSITVPASVTSIGESVFGDCPNLTLQVESGSYAETYAKENGVKFKASSPSATSASSFKTGSVGGKWGIIEYTGSDSNVVIPAKLNNVSIRTIGDTAFEKKASLRYVTIPEGVESLGSRSFAYNSGLLEVTIPKSVTKIGTWTFDNCRSLTLKVYRGTAGHTYAQKNNIPYKLLD